MPTLITSGDASNGAVITSSNDNALTIQTGAAGAKVNAIALASDGTATFLKNPVSSTAQSMIRMNTANGYGSTNNKIRRFSTTVTSQGSDITYADSAANGATFTINTSGVYAITFGDNFTAAGNVAIVLNDNQGTTGPLSTTTANLLSVGWVGSASNVQTVSTVVYLPANSVVSAKTDGTTSGTAANTFFTITRVA